MSSESFQKIYPRFYFHLPPFPPLYRLQYGAYTKINSSPIFTLFKSYDILSDRFLKCFSHCMMLVYLRNVEGLDMIDLLAVSKFDFD